MKSEGKGEMSKRGFSLGRIKSGLFIKCISKNLRRKSQADKVLFLIPKSRSVIISVLEKVKLKNLFFGFNMKYLKTKMSLAN